MRGLAFRRHARGGCLDLGAAGRIARAGLDGARDPANAAGPATLGRKRISGLALGHSKTHREGAQRKALRQLTSAWCAEATLPVSVSAETQNCGRFQGSKWLNIIVLLATS